MSRRLEVQFEKKFASGVTIAAGWEQPADAHSITVLFGPSGCGKTTVLRCLAGLERPETGAIRFDSEVWFDVQQRIHLAPQRRGIGFLFQDYALFPHLTVGGNLAYPLVQRDRNRVPDLLAAFDLRGLEDRYPHQISGGQQQRVALARALARRPRLLLLDEPLSALDGPTRDELRSDLRRLLAGIGVPVVLVTHDRIEAIALADHLVVMDHGQVRQRGPVDEVFSRPADVAVAKIVGTETVHQGEIISVEDGLAVVQVGPVRLLAVREKVSGTIFAAEMVPDTFSRVFVCIRGEDVALNRNAGDGSPRNQLAAVVESLTPEGPLVRVGLNCGFPLVALVTRSARTDLGLQIGDRLIAVVKAPAVHLIARPDR